jgi:transaldolase
MVPKAFQVKGLRALHKLVQSPWLDFISREILTSGELRRMIKEDGITGVTSNPTIFEKSINSSTAYDEEIKRLAGEGQSAERICDALIIRDVGDAADALLSVYDGSGGADGFVSIEVSPHLAYDEKATRDAASGIFKTLGRKNVLIKVPATAAGVRAIEELLFAGVCVNATLIFSMRHYEDVAKAYLRALQRRKKQGYSLKDVHSVASVFVSRIDTAVDKVIDKLLAAEKDSVRANSIRSLRGKAAVANSCLVYQRFKELFSGSEFLPLKASGARLQRIVWGSTGTKDPSYSDVKYVDELIGPDTVNTMPLQTIDAFKNHGVVRNTLEKGMSEANNVLRRLAEVGIDIDAICQQLQDEGVKAFAASYDALIVSIEKKRQGFLKT